MSFQNGIKFRSLVELWEWLPENERIIADVLRQIIIEQLPKGCKEKLTYNVPYYYGNRRICLIWPGAVPCGGFKSGVLLGFSQGKKLLDPRNYLTHGTNKQVYYRIFRNTEEVNEKEIITLLKDAVEVDRRFK
jgi:uncharacterized protein YdeI (YjbR/CyaY-like superfamily)